MGCCSTKMKSYPKTMTTSLIVFSVRIQLYIYSICLVSLACKDILLTSFTILSFVKIEANHSKAHTFSLHSASRYLEKYLQKNYFSEKSHFTNRNE